MVVMEDTQVEQLPLAVDLLVSKQVVEGLLQVEFLGLGMVHLLRLVSSGEVDKVGPLLVHPLPLVVAVAGVAGMAGVEVLKLEGEVEDLRQSPEELTPHQ
jgi:hypothetical protein